MILWRHLKDPEEVEGVIIDVIEKVNELVDAYNSEHKGGAKT